MDTLKISATANGLNYLPEYLADALGMFRDAGLDVTARACDPWTGVLDDLASGDADLALGGCGSPACTPAPRARHGGGRQHGRRPAEIRRGPALPARRHHERGRLPVRAGPRPRRTRPGPA